MFYVGLDLGKRRDHSAIAVIQKIERLRHRLLIRHLERAPLGTPYTAVVSRVREKIGRAHV